MRRSEPKSQLSNVVIGHIEVFRLSELELDAADLRHFGQIYI